jgi:hypothetical protein
MTRHLLADDTDDPSSGRVSYQSAHEQLSAPTKRDVRKSSRELASRKSTWAERDEVGSRSASVRRPAQSNASAAAGQSSGGSPAKIARRHASAAAS